MINSLSDKALNGTVVNRALPYLHGALKHGSLNPFKNSFLQYRSKFMKQSKKPDLNYLNTGYINQ